MVKLASPLLRTIHDYLCAHLLSTFGKKKKSFITLSSKFTRLKHIFNDQFLKSSLEFSQYNNRNSIDNKTLKKKMSHFSTENRFIHYIKLMNNVL